MTEKISWYQEVLDLEPGSRLFFPLSRLLAEDGQRERALHILEEGLRRNPDCLEARLFQIELLYRQGGSAACRGQMEELSTIFARYPGFWEAWSASLAASGECGDAFLAPLLLAASFQKEGLSLTQLLERGVRQLLRQDSSSLNAVRHEETAARHEGVAANVAEGDTQSPVEGIVPSPAPPCNAESRVPAGCAVAGDPPSPVRQTVPVAAMAGAAEESFSLRTRSMADLLAEQGDIPGALEIYQELAQTASTQAERSALEERMRMLRDCLDGEGVPDAAAPCTAVSADVLSFLDTLAQRLEARARGELPYCIGESGV